MVKIIYCKNYKCEKHSKGKCTLRLSVGKVYFDENGHCTSFRRKEIVFPVTVYETKRCNYCGNESVPTRISPFLDGEGKSMCRDCWENTKEAYPWMPKFEEGPGYDAYVGIREG